MATELLKIKNVGLTPFIVIVPRSEFEAHILKTALFNNLFYIVPDNTQKA